MREIRYFKENQGVLFPIREDQRKKKVYQQIRQSERSLKSCSALFQSNDFPHTQSHIPLSVKIVQFYSFVYHSVLCSTHET